MFASSHQIQAVADEESNRVVLRDQRGSGSGEDPQGACTLATEVKMEYDNLTDVMHVDVCLPSGDTRVDVLDVGECLGFPGQVVLRVNLDNKIIYGLTIQRFSAFKRTLLWRYRMASIQRALLLLLNTLRVGLWIDHGNRHAHLHA